MNASKFIRGLIAAVFTLSLSSNALADSDKLVVYFSRAGNQINGDLEKGNTATIAQMIAQKENADIFEIKPVEDKYNIPYRKLTELASEEKEKKVRPEYSGEVKNLSEYKTVYVGSPVWWGDYPMIMYTFFENNDLNGKVIKPFSTHEGSGLSSFDLILKSLYPKASVKEGLAIRGKEVQSDLDGVISKVNQWLDKE